MQYVPIISGMGESAGTPAHGLSNLRERLNSASSSVVAARYGFQDRTQIIDHLIGLAPTTAVTLIGHSWGGSVAVDVAIAIAPRPCRLYLIDPVPTDFGKQLTWRRFELPGNVTEAVCYRRSRLRWLLPFSKPIAAGENKTLKGDHNSIVRAACLAIQMRILAARPTPPPTPTA